MQVQAPHHYKRIEERHYSPHHTLLHIAELSLRKAEPNQPGWYNEAFICITFSALAVEALVNSVGARVVENWPEFERYSTKEKLKQLKTQLSVPANEHHETWRIINWLNAFRNRVAHPKPEHIVQEVLLASPIEPGSFDRPESSLEKLVSFERARDAYGAVHKAKGILAGHVPSYLSAGLEVDGWSSSTELVISTTNIAGKP